MCAKELAHCGGTSNLRGYLQRAHGDKYRAEKQPTLESFRRKCSEPRTKAIDQLLVGLVTKDMRLLNIVEREGLSCLLNYIEPGYRLPSLTKLVRKKHEHGQALLQEKLAQDAVFLALCLTFGQVIRWRLTVV